MKGKEKNKKGVENLQEKNIGECDFPVNNYNGKHPRRT